MECRPSVECGSFGGIITPILFGTCVVANTVMGMTVQEWIVCSEWDILCIVMEHGAEAS